MLKILWVRNLDREQEGELVFALQCGAGRPKIWGLVSSEGSLLKDLVLMLLVGSLSYSPFGLSKWSLHPHG